ncbi:MAG TPA: FGGY family carbohydrate kinase [Parafilimonas sp.]|nr:FGGY family carbohydrate kinase [Parafilimonas sp.]
MYLLGIDIGTSSVKVSVVDAQTQKCVANAFYPDTEAPIISLKTGWAEQNPDMWWEYLQQALMRANVSGKYNPKDIAAIGIAYQMHGLVAVNKQQLALRNSIIWCDSRAVEYGENAFHSIGEENCLCNLLNSPGNFTAAKLAWVKKNEPETFKQIYKIMLPGDFIAMRLTREITTTPSALSEGVFWNFTKNNISEEVMKYFGFDKNIIPEIKNVFSTHGFLNKEVADKLGLKQGIPVSYKAGDQLNNALSLNVLQPGEVAATAGTSGVIYAVTDKLVYDKQSRINSFVHVNHAKEKRIGVLLCINGAGIMNSWTKKLLGADKSYDQLNKEAANIPAGSDGVFVIPFGNGAERMLNNKLVGASVQNIDLNKHTPTHIYRAAHEGVAYAFRYGLDIMRENNIQPKVIRAGQANMFLSKIFLDAFVNVTNTPIELYKNDGSVGAALGAGIGAKIFAEEKEAFQNMKRIKLVEPKGNNEYDAYYNIWREALLKKYNHSL